MPGLGKVELGHRGKHSVQTKNWILKILEKMDIHP